MPPREQRLSREAKGLCGGCGARPPVRGKKRCETCYEACRRWVREHPEQRLEASRRWDREHPERRREISRRSDHWAWAIQERIGCQACGYNACGGALAFHHLRPEIKLFNLGATRGRTHQEIRDEVHKCTVLCSRCHSLLHCGAITIDPDQPGTELTEDEWERLKKRRAGVKPRAPKVSDLNAASLAISETRDLSSGASWSSTAAPELTSKWPSPLRLAEKKPEQLFRSPSN